MRGERPPSTSGPRPAEDLPVDPDSAAPLPAGPERPPRPRQWDVLAVIALGGGLGSVARYELAQAWPTAAGTFPWATFTINVTGSLLLGVLMVFVLEIWPPNRFARPFLGVGILGGYTTFSTYTVELRGLLATGHFAVADAYALTSLVAGLAAVWTGIALARRLGRLPVRRGPRRRSQAGHTATATARPEPKTGPGGAGEMAASSEGGPR
ncbi:fluoride efflux transporter FluC [Kitasatospora sp. NBC_01302]|nr:CrcB family protein [Kitasatospora sp. NBC_01302]